MDVRGGIMAGALCAGLLVAGDAQALDRHPPASRAAGAASRATIAAQGLAQRLLGARARDFDFAHIPKSGGHDVFEVDSARDRVVLRGSSGVALASALGFYLETYANAHVSWNGSQLALPQPLPRVPKKVRRVTPYRHRYYFNYCTFSYSMAWWGWERWEREIDWMALHGIDMPLAATGQEAVWQVVLRGLGLRDDEIAAFFSGPAYLAWHWMGNLDGWGGPLPQSWIDGQRDLQRKILARQRDLGMTPVLQGFTGHVPAGIRRAFPAAQTRTLEWSGFTTYVLDPSDPLFLRISRAFATEQRRQFGTDHLYAADTFNEMTPPSGEPADLARAARAVYEGLLAADPEAVWVMQGWLFGYQADFWTPPRVKALLAAVPKGRLIVLDLWAETKPQWKKTDGFHGTPWVWCLLHNFGGRTGLFGPLPQLAQGPPEALAAFGRAPIGLGITAEGIEHNPVVYDLFGDMVWRRDAPDLTRWVRDYARRRYGRAVPEAEAAWDVLRETVYSCPPGVNCSTRSPLGARPTLSPRPLRVDEGGTRFYEHKRLVEAWRLLLAAAPSVGGAETYRYDLVDLTRQVLVNLATDTQDALREAYRSRDRSDTARHGERILALFEDLDVVLAARPEFLLGRWLESAKSWGVTDAERRLYEWNARNQITLWSTPGRSLNDYAHKQWSGLIRDFDLPRWRLFLTHLDAALAAGREMDEKAFEAESLVLEEAWTRRDDRYPSEPAGDAAEIAGRMLAKYGPLADELYRTRTSMSAATGR